MSEDGRPASEDRPPGDEGRRPASEPLYVFDLRAVYVFAPPPDETDLPAAVRSQYNADRGRYELPTAELLGALGDAVGEVRVVTDTDAFTVAFADDPPGGVLDDALHVEWDHRGTRVLLATPDAVERALAAGGERVAREG